MPYYRMDQATFQMQYSVAKSRPKCRYAMKECYVVMIQCRMLEVKNKMSCQCLEQFQDDVAVVHSMTKPPKTIERTRAVPYVRPMPMASAWAAFEPSELLAVAVEELPKPVLAAVAPGVSAAELPVVEAVAAIVLMVEVLTRVGFCAPHGCEVRQDVTHASLLLPQLSAHWLLLSVHSKYGMVWEYSEALGDKPLPQTH